MSITKIQNDIIEEFSVFEDWMEKYEYMIELGKSLPVIDQIHKTEQNIIKGCQSKVWLSYKVKDGKLFFSGDSNTSITKGLLSLLIKVFSGQSPKDILESKLYFINQTGLCRFIGTQRSNGLEAMENKFKIIALSNK